MSILLSIDHLVILVRDLAIAGSVFENAGFQVTPETRHSPAMGTANRCVMLHGTYIELMGTVTETAANAAWRRLLDEGPGLRGLAFRSDDMDATAADFRTRGIQAEAVRHFSRMTDAGELRFSVTRIDPAETPGMQCLVCQHHTAGLVWLPQTMIHPNGASSLTGLALPDPQSLSLFASADGIPTVTGPNRIRIRGNEPAIHDLRPACGVVVEVEAE